MKSDLIVAINQIAAERMLPQLVVVKAVESALKSTYERDSTIGGKSVHVQINTDSGSVEVSTYLTVVDDDQFNPEDSATSIPLTEARKQDVALSVDDRLFTGELEYNQGRIAAQATKQMIIQNLNEVERNLVFEQFKDKEHKLVAGRVYRIERRDVLVELIDVNKAIATMPFSEQSPAENYRVGQQMRFYVSRVSESSRGSEIIVSRAHSELIRRLFEWEVPEIDGKTVEIKAIAREAGARSKVAVVSHSPSIDPIGTCVGLRGIRIQNIVNELMGEKVDVVEWSEDDSVFIMNALNPATVERTILNYETRSAQALVPERNLSLAIGKDGQNARLSAKLTNWTIDIVNAAEFEQPGVAEPEEEVVVAQETEVAATEQVPEQQSEQPPEPKEEKPEEEKVDIQALEEELARLKHVESQQKLQEQEEVIEEPEDTIDLAAEGLVSSQDSQSDTGGGLTFAEDIREVKEARTRTKPSSSGRSKKKRPAKRS